MLSRIPENARSAIVHTRAATQGTPERNENNHPIIIPGIAGIHNGMLVNDHTVSAKLKLPRVAEVDSEVIFHIIQNHGGIDAVGQHLDGDAAVAWMHVPSSEMDNPSVHVAHLGGRSCVYAWVFTRDEGQQIGTFQGVVFASTVYALDLAEEESGLDFYHQPNRMTLDDGQAIELLDGHVINERSNVTTITRPTRSKIDWSRADGASIIHDPYEDFPPFPADAVRDEDPFPGPAAEAVSQARLWMDADLDAIMRHPTLGVVSSRDEWTYEDTNSWGDDLYFNEKLIVWASLRSDTGTVTIHTDYDDVADQFPLASR